MNCKKCGTRLTAADVYCPKCGERADFSDNSGEVICPICETTNASGAAHCAVCGEALSKTSHDNNSHDYHPYPENVFCAYCGTQNPSTNKCCSNCGRNLSDTEIPTSPPTPPAPHQNSYTPIIIGLTITAVLAVIIALVVLIIDYLGDGVSDSVDPTPTSVVEVTSAPTDEPTAEPTSIPTPAPTPMPTQSYNSSYSVYDDYGYAFSCPYPNNMYKISPVSDFTRLCLGSYNGGKIYICGTINDNGRTATKVADNFKSSYTYNSVLINDIGANYCSVLISDGYKYHYCYYSLTEGMIRGFEMEFSTSYYETYMNYADYMRRNISL